MRICRSRDVRRPALLAALVTGVVTLGTTVAVPHALAHPAGPGGSAATVSVSRGAPWRTSTDQDGDGLLDSWEKYGLDADGNGTIDVNLPAMGASVTHKDIFVEMDYMDGRLPSTTVLDRIRSVFASAPVGNPDGRSGISIHLDAGSARGSAYNLGGGNLVPTDSEFGSEREFTTLQSRNFKSSRAKVFHYMVWAEKYWDGCSSGYSPGIPGSTFWVSLGSKCWTSPGNDKLVGTFVHELGHGLGLSHGGADGSDVNYKPNYLSVMNYAFQFGGVPHVDGSRNFGYSDSDVDDLDENALSEIDGLSDGADSYSTWWFCPGAVQEDEDFAKTDNYEVDWNCDGRISSGTVRADVNADGSRTVLTSTNDWASLIYDGGPIGGAGTRSRVKATSVREPSKRELMRAIR